MSLICLPWAANFLRQCQEASQSYPSRPFDWHEVGNACYQTLAVRWQDTPRSAAVAWCAAAGCLLPALAMLVWGHSGLSLIGLCILVTFDAIIAFSAGVQNVLMPRYLVFAHALLLCGLPPLLLARDTAHTREERGRRSGNASRCRFRHVLGRSAMAAIVAGMAWLCARLHAAVGSQRLLDLGMPCVDYIDRNDQATARSMHPGGAHVLFVDGAARFVRDDVDRGLWHVMHSRETPAEVLAEIDEKSWGGLPMPSGVNEGSDATKEPTPAHSRVPLATETLTNSLGMRFVTIPAGAFTMGIPDIGNNGPAPPECPPHEVTISHAFWLGEREVTQAQYNAVMGHNPSHHLPHVARVESTDDFPVENVSWHEAAEFCQRLSNVPAEQHDHRRYRLPTEAEWEYGCRSGNSAPYRWHRERPQDDKSGDNAGMTPSLPLAKAGTYLPNDFGLYDMRGNVWEWCADWFDRGYYSRSPLADPQGPAEGYLKVVRGGDWIFVGEPCHINYPIMPPWKASPYVGFRVVCEVE